jgi:hypothetical protein
MAKGASDELPYLCEVWQRGDSQKYSAYLRTFYWAELWQGWVFGMQRRANQFQPQTAQSAGASMEATGELAHSLIG